MVDSLPLSKLKVYVETTIFSYLAARPSSAALLLAHQLITHEWWSLREKYALFASDLVELECNQGDTMQVSKRVALLADCKNLAIEEQDYIMAQALLSSSALPQKASVDAIHIAIAARHKMDLVLTWNCKHIANPATQHKIHTTLLASGLAMPLMITPEILLEHFYETNN
jgi:hypothetical protein